MLLFNGQPGSIPALNGENKGKGESEQSLRKMVTILATRLLPHSEWDIRSYTGEEHLRKSEWLDRAKVPVERPDLVIVDMWFRKDDFKTRRIDEAISARKILTDIKKKFKQEPVCCILTATLPEPTADPCVSADAPIDHFVPLAHTNINGWDELFNVIKIEESRLLFGDVRAACTPTLLSNIPTFAPYTALQIDRPLSQYSRSTDDIVVDGSGTSSGQPLDLNQHIFEGFVIIRNCHLTHLRIRDCEFHKPVLLENCTFDRPCVLASCKFSAHLNIQSCVFNQDVFIERCNFAPTPDGAAALNQVVSSEAAAACAPSLQSTIDFEHRLPWFNRTQFQSRFVFRNNMGIPPTPAHVHVLMFNRCGFEGQVDLELPDQPTKLVFYASSFRSGRHTDIRFPYIRAELTVGVDKSQDAANDAMRSRFHPFSKEDEPDFDHKVLEMRFCLCNLAGQIAVREHPWALNPFLVEKFDSTSTVSGRAAVRPMEYSAQDGLGLNLCGSTLSGSLHLRSLRIRWINCERITVLGGALFLNSSALRIDRAHHKRIISPLALAPEIGRIVFDELVGYGEEPPRFSTLIQHSKRLMEYSQDAPARIEMMRRIVQQYDDLRKAFSNGSNSHGAVDYCYYKMMMYTGDIQRALLSVRGLIASLVVGTAALLLIAGLIWHSRTYSPMQVIVANYEIVLLGLVSFALLSPTQHWVRAYFDLVVYRKMFAYLVYPRKIIMTGMITIVVFAVLYGLLELLGSRVGPDGQPPIGRLDLNIQEANQQPEQVTGAVAQLLDHIGRCLHFSAVTFTTLGFRDVRASGMFGVVSNVEAFVGALYLSMLTVAMVRQVTRR